VTLFTRHPLLLQTAYSRPRRRWRRCARCSMP